jgi:hypothetical protein
MAIAKNNIRTGPTRALANPIFNHRFVQSERVDKG